MKWFKTWELRYDKIVKNFHVGIWMVLQICAMRIRVGLMLSIVLVHRKRVPLESTAGDSAQGS